MQTTMACTAPVIAFYYTDREGNAPLSRQARDAADVNKHVFVIIAILTQTRDRMYNVIESHEKYC